MRGRPRSILRRWPVQDVRALFACGFVVFTGQFIALVFSKTSLLDIFGVELLFGFPRRIFAGDVRRLVNAPDRPAANRVLGEGIILHALGDFKAIALGTIVKNHLINVGWHLQE